MAKKQKTKKKTTTEHTTKTSSHKTTSFFERKSVAVSIIVILILISMFFSVYFRSFPATLPVAEKWAETSITSNIKAQVTAGVNSEYPYLPADKKTELVNERVAQVVQEQQESIDTQVQQQAEFIRAELQNDDGQTYLLAIDPYYYLHRVENIVNTGTVCDEIVDGECRDDRVLAPLGSQTNLDYHSAISAGFYKLVDLFSDPNSILAIFFWMPVLISAIAVIPAFFIARKKAGNFAGFIAATIVAVHSSFLGRTPAGFSDTDAYNVTMPLMIFWMFIEAVETKSLKHKILFTALMGLFTGMYAKLWAGWWYIFDFAVVVIIVQLGHQLVKEYVNSRSVSQTLKHTETKHLGITALSFIVFSGIFTSIMASVNTFLKAPLNPLGFTTIQNAANADLWPNVFTTVAELNQASLQTIITQIGGGAQYGPFFFFLAMMGVILSMIGVKNTKVRDWILLGSSAVVFIILVSKPAQAWGHITYLAVLLLPLIAGLVLQLFDKREIDTKYAIFLAVWFVGTIYAGTQGVRFILLLVPAYAVALGILIGQLYRMSQGWLAKMKMNDWIAKGVFVVITIFLLVQPITLAKTTAEGEVPSMNDSWWNSLKKIDQEASPDAIINSWWDFGHWFKTVGGRAATFDGGSQNSPMAHWIGRALSTPNEQEAIGILRMLDCGSREGFKELAAALQDGDTTIRPETTLEGKEIMDTIILMSDRDQAQDYLIQEAGISQADAQKITELTHCQPPENYFITSGDMVGKAGVWGHFGAWDFKRAYVFSVLSKQPVDQATPVIAELFNVEAAQASKIYQDAFLLRGNQDAANAWISPWPGYVTQPGACQAQGEIIVCQMQAQLAVQQGQIIRLQGAIINTSDLQSTQFVLGFYNQQTGELLEEQRGFYPVNLHFGDNETLTTTKIISEKSIGYDLTVWQTGENSYRALAASPELAPSLFTKLYYMNGKYTEQFEKFSDETSPITGDRIIIWKVDWN